MTDKLTISLTVNGERREVDVEPRWLLSDVLRHELGLTGTHVGCEHGVCGCCTVLINDAPARSCLALAVTIDGAEITTVEGIAVEDGRLHPLQESFQKHHGLQCGFCTPGFLMTAMPFWEEAEEMTDDELRKEISGQLCRCTGYTGILASIRGAAAIARDRSRPIAETGDRSRPIAETNVREREGER